MAYNLCSSPSSLFHDLPSISSSPSSSSSSSSSRKFKLRNLSSSSFQPSPSHSLTLPSKTLLHAPQVSLHEPIPEQVPSEGNSSSSSSSYKSSRICVTPPTPSATQLARHSYDARYTSLVNVANSLDSCNPSPEDVSLVLKSLGDRVLEHAAVTVITNMSNSLVVPFVLSYFQSRIKPTREAILYNVTLKVFRKGRDLDAMEKIFDEMLQRGVRPDNVTFSTIISCARICLLPHKAVEWFEKMSSFGCEPDEVTYSVMIDAYGRAGNIDMALRLYDRARTESWRLDTVTFSTLIKMYGLAGNYDGCLNVYQEMKVLGVKPNMVIYNTLLDAMGRAKRPWQAKSIFTEMMNNGLSPNWVTYASLLRAYGRGRYSEDALFVYKEMREKGMEMNTHLYNTLLAMCADLGLADDAFKIFEDMKSSATCLCDSWTFSSLITIYSCSGNVSDAERMLNEMIESGFEPTIFVLTSLVQCYGKAGRTDDVVKTFDQLLDLGISPDDRFCGCLLNVMTQTPKEELFKLNYCVDKANPKLGSVVRYLVEGLEEGDGEFRKEASELFDSIADEVKKPFCNSLIDLCVNLNLLDMACQLLDIGLSREIYTDIQTKSQTQWSLHLKSLSLGASLTALHAWINDLSKVLESGEDLPPVLGINTGHGKHRYSEKGLASVVESHLNELNAPFHEAPDKAGWFLTTEVAAKSWLESREMVTA